ncbi:type II toxin-antitoxin system RelE/ParE family toxin [Nocardioides humilatus]|uniref:Type II toxin-antitoxin system RelE/ParE family toxin n=1 Tax=Nocardioides humilatus TaxID=2607660 RepID=A0A5B1LNP8_9ACTN|nr:type II toxin-antitoxin system RelE/ParE family toxin [Nocardioides humilatus]KAA1421227.1 type II toxin-antitoxin system RelE/ParE family toxin [Nocardioides humilatus]
MRVRFTDRAVADIVEARDHYDVIDPILGAGFLRELDVYIERLTLFPNASAPVQDLPGVRRGRLRRFPYGIFHRVVESDGEVVVLRVLHASRHTDLADDV